MEEERKMQMEEEKKSKWAGIPMTEEELEEEKKVWEDIEENFKLLEKKGKNI